MQRMQMNIFVFLSLIISVCVGMEEECVEEKQFNINQNMFTDIFWTMFITISVTIFAFMILIIKNVMSSCEHRTKFEKGFHAAANKQKYFDECRKKDSRFTVFIDEILKHTTPSGNLQDNPILESDSYKASQYNMSYATKFDKKGKKQRLTHMHVYIEARTSARYPHIIVAGNDANAKFLVETKIEMWMIYDAIHFYKEHFKNSSDKSEYIFNPFPWLAVVLKHNGVLPMKYCGIPDGTRISIATPMCTLENTDPDCAQIVSHFEGKLMQNMWYPSTVAKNALMITSAIREGLLQTTSEVDIDSLIDFVLQDFGYRSTTCQQAAIIGGSAALYVTKGSDTVSAVKHAMDTINNGEMSAYAFIGIEHNYAMMLGREGEFDQFKLVLDAYPKGSFGYVIDTYNMEKFLRTVTTGNLFDQIMRRKGTVWLRPDSNFLNEDGSEMTSENTILKVFSILQEKVPYTTNTKGFKVLTPQFRVVYGDGLSIQKIKAVRDALIKAGWCLTNICFGVGTNLLQNLNRDTLRMALKASEETFEIKTSDGITYIEVRNVCKETPGKQSKKGRFHISKSKDGNIQVKSHNDPSVKNIPNILVEYYKDGHQIRERDSLNTIRARVKDGRKEINI